jgi:hypothetical protein
MIANLNLLKKKNKKKEKIILTEEINVCLNKTV